MYTILRYNCTVYRLNILYTQAGGNGDTCWRKQCSRCKEFYIGDPVDGHQEKIIHYPSLWIKN